MPEVLEMPNTTTTTVRSVNLNEKAMLVSLVISQWTARKYDRKATEEVAEQNEAKTDAGRYNKQLIDKDALKGIIKAISALRTFHYKNTFQWNDNGERLLPSANYFTYVNELNKLRTEYDNAVQVFLEGYDHHVQEARNRLGKLFDINEYPHKEQIQTKFGVKPVFMPVPPTDFRVGLNGAEAAKLKSAAETEINERVERAMKDAWHRIKDQLVKMKEKLSDKDAKFRNSLFENLQELVDLLPRMNITNDMNIENICNDMKQLINDADTVRSDDTIRDLKAKQVENLIESYKDFF